jgi:4-hydroxy-tetrahydrodipicolinate synthase
VADSEKDGGGLYAYLVTPYDKRGDVDPELLADYVRAIVQAGVAGVTCLASTCEGPYLTDEERELVAKTVGKVVASSTRLNIGVGAFSTRQVIENAKRAEDAGASSIMLEMQQYFPVTFEAAYRHYEAIGRAVRLPIRLYNLPLPTRFDFTPDRIALMADIPAIHSVKEASGDVTRLRDIRALCGTRFKLHCGFHFQALDGFRYGADGWEVMLHPLIAKACIGLHRTLETDPWSASAEAEYRRLEPLFHFFKQCGVPQSIKAMSEWTDLNLGQPREPYGELSPSAKARLRDIVKQLDLL